MNRSSQAGKQMVFGILSLVAIITSAVGAVKIAGAISGGDWLNIFSPGSAYAATGGECIITLFGRQYDVTSLRNTHSGGDVFVCGTDMTVSYQARHGTNVSRMQPYLVVVPTPTPTVVPTATPTPTLIPTVTPIPTITPGPTLPPIVTPTPTVPPVVTITPVPLIPPDNSVPIISPDEDEEDDDEDRNDEDEEEDEDDGEDEEGGDRDRVFYKFKWMYKWISSRGSGGGEREEDRD